MALNIRSLLRNYRIPILGLVGLQAACFWFGGINTRWDADNHFEISLDIPYIGIAMMLLFQYALGRRGRGD